MKEMKISKFDPSNIQSPAKVKKKKAITNRHFRKPKNEGSKMNERLDTIPMS